MTDVWLTEDLPFLHAVRAAEDEAPPGASVSIKDNQEHFDLELDKALKVATRLMKADYIDAKPLETMAGTLDVYVDGLTERGRRAVGQWPSDDPWASLVELLSQQIEEEQDEAKKGKLVRFRDAVLTGGREVVTSVLTEMAKQQMGI